MQGRGEPCGKEAWIALRLVPGVLLMYVIQRTDGQYVSHPGSDQSYTRKLEEAQVFGSKGEAEKELCVENERVIAMKELLLYPGKTY